MGILKKLLGGQEQQDSSNEESPKLWKVGNHRVKEATLKSNWYHRGASGTDEFSGYECVNCEKTNAHRSNFKRKECFEVIQE